MEKGAKRRIVERLKKVGHETCLIQPLGTQSLAIHSGEPTRGCVPREPRPDTNRFPDQGWVAIAWFLASFFQSVTPANLYKVLHKLVLTDEKSQKRTIECRFWRIWPARLL